MTKRVTADLFNRPKSLLTREANCLGLTSTSRGLIMSAAIPTRFTQMLQEVWGFSELRHSQHQAILAALNGNDALVVMPTGGGKSLCYQAPAVYRGGLTIVISPLIALMKDQVDSLHQLGIPAARWDSTSSPTEKRQIIADLRNQKIRLLFASPERALQKDFHELFLGNQVHTIAIDEAHCVSQWGHDFRPEYRRLATLREHFPNASMMALTATATTHVQKDIIDQLQLKNPTVSINSFDRPNLTYRIIPQGDVVKQCQTIIDRHSSKQNPNPSNNSSNNPSTTLTHPPTVGGIIYCLKRSDVDDLAAALASLGYRAVGYHAGLTYEERQKAQDAFMKEQVDVVVATIAFGMGIDRSNVRYVIHTAIPKSMESYQQETGRAGRDGLKSECVLLFSMRDVHSMRSIIKKSSADNNAPESWLNTQMKLLDSFVSFCKTPCCRHRSISEYFGQNYPLDNCNACDLCLGEIDVVENAKILAQKILSCVHHMGERFGIQAICDVLAGSNSAEIKNRNHQALSTFGILKEYSRKEIRNWIEQLIGLGALNSFGDPYPVLKLGPKAKGILFGNVNPPLARLAGPINDAPDKSLARFLYDQALFDRLRTWRHETALKSQVAPSVLFSDRVLAELAAIRPSKIDSLRSITGIGEQQLRNHGTEIINVIQSYCDFRNVSMDQPFRFPNSPQRIRYAQLFQNKKSLAQIAAFANISEGTVANYLADAILANEIRDVSPWLSHDTYSQICSAAAKVGTERLKPIYDELQEKIPYSLIHIALAYQKANPKELATP